MAWSDCTVSPGLGDSTYLWECEHCPVWGHPWSLAATVLEISVPHSGISSTSTAVKRSDIAAGTWLVLAEHSGLLGHLTAGRSVVTHTTTAALLVCWVSLQHGESLRTAAVWAHPAAGHRGAGTVLPWGCVTSQGEEPASSRGCADTLGRALQTARAHKGDFYTDS